MKEKIIFITPTYNANNQILDLHESLIEQNNKNWQWYIIDDMSTDETWNIINKLSSASDNIICIKNSEKKHALKNIYDTIYNIPEENLKNSIIAIVDGDDYLCNENTVEYILKEYNKNADMEALWTAHSWDINGLNISSDLPKNINPYHYPWVSSHLKTFTPEVFKKVNKENFKDTNGEWFKRGYDQALYLPILYLAKGRKYLNETCYLYRMNSNSLKNRDAAEREQLNSVKLVRARGLIE